MRRHSSRFLVGWVLMGVWKTSGCLQTGMGQLEVTLNNTMNNYHTDEAW
jgi:hypothetical protein